MRDLDKNPYSEEEARVAAFLADERIMGGDDPIGTLMCSYHQLVWERNDLLARVLDAAH